MDIRPALRAQTDVAIVMIAMNVSWSPPKEDIRMNRSQSDKRPTQWVSQLMQIIVNKSTHNMDLLDVIIQSIRWKQSTGTEQALHSYSMELESRFVHSTRYFGSNGTTIGTTIQFESHLVIVVSVGNLIICALLETHSIGDWVPLRATVQHLPGLP